MEDVNHVLCVLCDDAPTIGDEHESAAVRQCSSCERDVWHDTESDVPEPYVLICKLCVRKSIGEGLIQAKITPKDRETIKEMHELTDKELDAMLTSVQLGLQVEGALTQFREFLGETGGNNDDTELNRDDEEPKARF